MKINNKSKEKSWLMKCPKCGERRGKMRAGADFAGEAICYSCWYVWSPSNTPFYARIP